MKKLFIILVLSILFSGIVSAADFNRYKGTWGNLASGTLTVSKMEIGVEDSKVHIHTWGALRPKKDYDWGATGASTHSDGHLSLRYRTATCTRNLTVNLTRQGTIIVKTKTHYTDGSGRADTEVSETLRRVLIPDTQTPEPMDPVNPIPASQYEPTGKY